MKGLSWALWAILAFLIVACGSQSAIQEDMQNTAVARPNETLPRISDSAPPSPAAPSPKPTLDGFEYPDVPLPTPDKDKSAPPDNWQLHWLEGKPCLLPCWEGIVPGQTTIEEAVELLNKSPFVAVLELYPLTGPDTEGMVNWDWATGNGGGFITFNLHGSPRIVTAIGSVFHKPFTLGEVIKVYGEPSHVVAEVHTDPHDVNDRSKDSFSIHFIFQNHGFYIWDSGLSEKPEITAELSLFGRVDIFSNQHMRIADIVPWATTVPWEGFKDFDYYAGT